MDIEKLVNKYFEGETTCEEERELRSFFTQGIVPEHLEEYRPLFAFFEEEIKQNKEVAVEKQETKLQRTRSRGFRRYTLYALSGIAAGIVLVLSIAGIHKHFHSMPENYVMIDGKCYIDENLIHENAIAAFQNVSFNEDEILQNLLNGE